MKKQQTLRVLANKFNTKRSLNPPTLEKIINEISKSINPNDIVLDLGCGSGRILIPLAKKRPDVKFVGVDISEDMLKEFIKKKPKKCRNISLIRADYNNLEYLKKKIPYADVILSFQAIQFISNIRKFFIQTDKFLYKKGIIIIATTTPRQFYKLPYCIAFPQVLNIELKRTPDIDKIVKLFKTKDYKMVSRISIKIQRKFNSAKSVKNWLMKVPFSALTLISERNFKTGLNDFIKRFKDDIIIDEFDIITLKK